MGCSPTKSKPKKNIAFLRTERFIKIPTMISNDEESNKKLKKLSPQQVQELKSIKSGLKESYNVLKDNKKIQQTEPWKRTDEPSKAARRERYEAVLKMREKIMNLSYLKESSSTESNSSLNDSKVKDCRQSLFKFISGESPRKEFMTKEFVKYKKYTF